VALVDAFVTSRVDYCNSVLASATKTVTDKLQSVLNAASHQITATQKYERGLSRLMLDDLHWLTVPDAQYTPPTRLNCRVEFRRRRVGVGGVY